ncbi:hypothetical protein [Salinisphaera sp. T5B8]|uniref:hypothetical protein n=1 Tax=Salinisphaera sp. T5B8 TaxID=1304154 RepID=UPI00333FF38A
MSSQTYHRDQFLSTLDHLGSVYAKVAGALGRKGLFTFPDHHKLAEGLFLSAWTHWEEFARVILLDDLSEDPNGFVRADVKKFRVKGAPRRIAERVLVHPDHPNSFINWDYGLVKSRADTFLGHGHRFANTLPRASDLDKMKRIRNAVAHKSDRAWASFKGVVKYPPFSLAPNQMKGITVGRFLVSHNWNNQRVILECFDIHRAHAWHLVP